MGDEALRVSSGSLFPASELMKTAGYNLISAGMDVKQATGALRDASDLAVGGMGNLEQASEILSTTFNTFGVDTQRAADVFAGTVAMFQTTLPKLYQGFKYTAGSAAAAGITFEETAAALGMLQTKGLDASRAGTGLNAVMRALPKAEKELKIATRDASGAMLSLADIMAQLEKKYGPAIDSTREMAELQAVFGEEGYRAIVALYGQSSALRDYTSNLGQSGTAAKMAQARMAGYEGQMARFRNEMDNLRIVLGQHLLPHITELMGTVSKLVEWFGKLPEPMQKVIAYGTGLGSLLIPLAGIVNYLIQWRRQAVLTEAAMRLLNQTSVAGGAVGAAGRGAAGAGGLGLVGGLTLGGVAVGTAAGIGYGESLGRKSKLSWWEQGLSMLGPIAVGRALGTGASAIEYLKGGGSIMDVFGGKYGLGAESWARALEAQREERQKTRETFEKFQRAIEELKVVVQIDGKEVARAVAREQGKENRRIP
jgi:TP901 family phage tail tape measure protein